ncbi:Gfo/Idh/MocA family protein [Natronobeatus ordinarius]|uniref:Gfo/Idh/MocA family protein n=1 Tax=Natronobeatus ordinarius TaxID=2963433 RepID=UPI0020CE4629|nr:Gfo/Idh/MocA family oxidoreductase [Natronobeatus ordinarius]
MARERSPIDVGVIGVGTMGNHHARVYDALPTANLVGVSDVDERRARRVAQKYETSPMAFDRLLRSVDAVSVAVPTAHHYDVTTACLDAGVAPLVEKPIASDLEEGRRLRAAAARADVPVQVGHVERFNPAVTTLEEIVSDLSIVSVAAERLGPPPDRRIDDSAVLDLMIHDIDVVCSLLGETPETIESAGVRDNRYASALLSFDSGRVASLTASRLTQRKVRRLRLTARQCLVELDYTDQSIEIHRRSYPEYVERNGDVRYRHESIVERPQVSNDEPLRRQLESFLEAVATNDTPAVTIDDGVAALEIAHAIDENARREQRRTEIIDD